MSLTATTLTAVENGARYLGKAVLPEAREIRLFQLTGTPSDHKFLQKGLDTFEQMTRQGKGFVPAITGIDYANHQELGQEAFEKSLSILSALQAGKITTPPLIVVALNKTNELVGMSLSHIERHLDNGSRLFTPVRHQVEQLTTDNHSSLNWLTKYTEESGIGKLLTAMNERLLPDNVKRVDVVSEVEEYTPHAPKLYQGMGFKVVEELKDAFKGIHGVAMSAKREDYKQAATRLLDKFAFKPAEQQSLEKLDEIVQFRSFDLPETAINSLS